MGASADDSATECATIDSATNDSLVKSGALKRSNMWPTKKAAKWLAQNESKGKQLEMVINSKVDQCQQCYNLDPLFSYLTLIFPPTHFSHDRVLVSHAYLSSDSLLSQPCTLSHALLHYDSQHPYLRNIYIDLGIRCKYPT